MADPADFDALKAELAAKVDLLNLSDAAEDAAYQAQIDTLTGELATMTIERDDAVAALTTVTTERDALLVEKDTFATIVSEVRDLLDQLTVRVTTLEGQ